MNRRVSVAEAKNKLPAIIHEVEKGSIVEITRHGDEESQRFPVFLRVNFGKLAPGLD